MKTRELLRKGLRELSLDASGEQVDSFMAYLAELSKWSRAYSLTALKTDRDIVVKHFLDSCLYLKAMGEHVQSLADVGSGAGLPGIPIKILRPEIMVYLIEPVQKKAAFLRHVIARLSLQDIVVKDRRVEDVDGMEVDVAVTRALFSAKEFVRHAGHVVREGGSFILSKGPRVKEELSDLDSGYELRTIPLPLSDITRHLLVIPRKISTHR